MVDVILKRFEVPDEVRQMTPLGVPPAGNEAGWRSSLGKLAALVEAGDQ